MKILIINFLFFTYILLQLLRKFYILHHLTEIFSIMLVAKIKCWQLHGRLDVSNLFKMYGYLIYTLYILYYITMYCLMFHPGNGHASAETSSWLCFINKVHYISFPLLLYMASLYTDVRVRVTKECVFLSKYLKSFNISQYHWLRHRFFSNYATFLNVWK
jgi:hypothetical protein